MASNVKNIIIDKDHMEGVHCKQSSCTIQNVCWEDLCEDALSIKGDTASSVIQHNGQGSASIEGFYAQDVVKLYRSCNICGGKSHK
ncbi:hypothetical protein JG688_00018574, partial [Phytophthora aleatoria]